MASKNVKKRNWSFFVYPESAPSNWIDIIQQTGLPFTVSPLHDRDLQPDGTPKKAHFHVILCYPGPTTYNSVKVLTDSLKQPIPQAVDHVGGYYRYFSHKDYPDKAQYDEKDISCYNGFSILNYTELTRGEVTTIKRNLQTLIRNLDISEYSVFMDYLLDNELNAEYEVASNNTYFFEKYLSSRRNYKK